MPVTAGGPTTVVAGATGNVGSEVTRALVARGHAVRALSRRGTAPDGADAVFLPAGYPDAPGLLADMRAAGVGRVVVLSTGAVPGGDLDNAVTRFNVVTEAAARDSGMAWTVLRPSGFMTNTLGWAGALCDGDVVVEPFADVPIAVIDPVDIGEVAALALTEPGHEGLSHRLTGPEALLPADRLAVLAELLGRELRLEPEPDHEARARMAAGTPAEMVEAFFRFFRGGEYDDSGTTPTVEQLLGRPPRTFRAWASEHLGAFGV
jgi:uncharacterized protein YbjT (DUF2867 family)